MDLEFREHLIEAFINSVYLFDDKVIIYYNIEGGQQVSFIEMLEDVGDAPSPDADLDLPEEGSYSIRPNGFNHSKYEPVFIYHKKTFGIILQRVS